MTQHGTIAGTGPNCKLKKKRAAELSGKLKIGSDELNDLKFGI